MADAINNQATLGIPSQNLRVQLEQTVQSLIDILDVLGPDPDLEVDDDPEDDSADCCTAGDDGSRYGVQYDHAPGDPEDAEDDNEDCCSVLDRDGELSLSSLESIDQTYWSHGGSKDLEADYCDDEEDDPPEDEHDREMVNEDGELESI